MSFYRFSDDDVLTVDLRTTPSSNIINKNNAITGAVYLENPYLTSTINRRVYSGFSEKEGGLVERSGSFSASINFYQCAENGTNKQYFRLVKKLYDYYKIASPHYTSSFTGAFTPQFKIIEIPEVYYDKSILSGSLFLFDYDSSSKARELRDNGIGGIYSGSMTGTIVGNIFYNEGIIALKEQSLMDFGTASTQAVKWQVSLKGEHKIPVKVFKCRAPAGELNTSANATFSQMQLSGNLKGFDRAHVSGSFVYVTSVGLYNENYELVATINITQPIKKLLQESLLIRAKLDF